MQSSNKFNHTTQIVGVMGHPIKHSYSPLMHNISFEILNLNYIYLPFDVTITNLKTALKGMVALGIKGVNVTLPLKEKIGQYLNEVSDEAGIVGAVNTVVNENGNLHGYNTDVHGIIETIAPFKDEISGQTVTVIGAGGAARGVLYALIKEFKPEKINIVNRTADKAESLKEYFINKMLFENIYAYELLPPDLVGVFHDSKMIINSTSIGMSPDVDDTPTTIPESFHKDQIVFDVVYTPLKTKLLEIAESQGALALNGLKMFVEQGAKSFELWTEQLMPKEKIYQTLKSYMEA
jgi:shikimate dehydrogenase